MFSKNQLLTFVVLLYLLLGNLKANPNYSYEFFAPPTLVAPSDGATNVPFPTPLQWTGTSGTVSVQIYENCSETTSSVNSINLNAYQQTAGPIYISGVPDDLSGITYNPLTGTLFMITNKNSEIIETTLSGGVIRNITLNGFDDPEGIAHLYGNRFAISEEELGRVLYIDIHSNTTSVNLNNASYTQIQLSFGTWSNKGLEGVSYNPDTGDYYAVKEDLNRTIFRYNGTPTSTYASLSTCNLENSSFGMTDVSDIFHLAKPTGLDNLDVNDKILVLSDESNKIVEIDNNCGLYSTLFLPSSSTQAEGITMDDNGTIYVVSEPNMLFIFNNPNLELNPISETQGTLVFSATSGGSSFTIPDGVLDADTEYCWRVGKNGEWSDMWSFTTEPSDGITVTSSVSMDSDDAEEAANGMMDLNSTDLELVQENSTQEVGIVFRGLNIPQGANIEKANLQFTTDEISLGTTNLIIRGEDINSAFGFTSVSNNISNRNSTSAQVSWQVDPWSSAGQSGNAQKSPDIKTIIQEIVNRSGFNTNSNIGIIISGSGKRVAESFNGGGTAQAPKLTVTYNQACPATGTPCDDGDVNTENDVADGNCGCAGTCLPQGIACNDGDASTINDITDGNCGCQGTLPCDPQGTPCNDNDATTYDDVEDGNCGCAGINCPTAGTTCNDNIPTTGNDMEDGECNCVGTPCPPQGTPCDDGDPNTENDVENGYCTCGGIDAGSIIESRIAAGDDDVEENGKNGNMYLNSSDLELVYDRSYTGNQIIGLRFTDVYLPPGATIKNAYVQFTTDEARNTNGNKLIRAESTNNSAPYTTQKYNLSSRTKTQAVVAWTPPSWDIVDESGAKQRTNNIASIIQELVDRDDWEGFSTAITIIIEGGGRRVAESYNGSPQNAPLLYIKYQYNGQNLVHQPDEETDLNDPEEEAEARVEVSSIQDVTLYPNPTTYEVNVDIQINEPNTTEGTVTLFDIAGKTHSQIPFNPQTERSVEIEVAHLPQGTYLVHVQVGEHIATRKFVKK